MGPPVAGILIGAAPPRLVTRTRRALDGLGVRSVEVSDAPALAAALAAGVWWFVRAGATPAEVPSPVVASRTGKAIVAFGASLDPPAPAADAPDLGSRAAALLAATGGVVDVVDASLPCVALALCARAAEVAALQLQRAADDPEVAHLLLTALSRASVRGVRDASLDACFGEAVRVAEIVTSLQIGGAEVVARSLAEALPRAGVAARLFALGSPTRARLPEVPGEVDLGASGLAPARRIARLVSEIRAWGADVAHAHLFGLDVIDALAAAGLPPVVTIHNAKQGFPEGTRDLGPARARLVVGCARAVVGDLREAGVTAPLRAVPNGIDVAPLRERGAAGERRGRALRAAWKVAPGAIVVLIVANPRPQKRLDRVAPIARALADRVAAGVHVVWAGAPSARDDHAKHLAASFVASLEAARVPLTALGAVTDVAPVLAAADVVLGTSDWEGLSLAQLEAIAAGVPVVATDVGGTAEIASACDQGWLTLVDADAVEIVAQAILRAAAFGAQARARGAPDLPLRFERRAMVRGYARLLRSAASGARCGEARDRSGLVLVTNNFSPGGAQQSARRLLVALARRGRAVTAITLEEDDAHPTPGLVALRRAGVEVIAAPRIDPERAIASALDRCRAHREIDALVFWNAIAEHKILATESAFASRVFDVSPGEMYFDSLARYFARPRPDAVADARAYGALLAGAVVKFEAERARAEDVLGCPVEVIPNGVPIVAEPRAWRGSAPFRFGTAVRIHAHKRLDLLLDAFRRVVTRHPGCELLVAGTADAGQDQVFAALRAESADLPVRWLGFREDVTSFLEAIDAFVLVAEPAGCPNASLEALGAGLPVIATDVGGIREQLGDDAGIVVPRVDAGALAEAMLRAAGDPALYQALARRGHTRARERFSIARMADAYERLFFGARSPEETARLVPEPTSR